MTMTKMEIMQETRKMLRDNSWRGTDLTGITIEFDNAAGRFGQWHQGKRQISYSWRNLQHCTREDIMNTISHEVAHAIVGTIHKHDRVWASMHRELGGTGEVRGAAIPLEARLATAKYRVECTITQRVLSTFNRRVKRVYNCRCHRAPVTIIQQR